MMEVMIPPLYCYVHGYFTGIFGGLFFTREGEIRLRFASPANLGEGKGGQLSEEGSGNDVGKSTYLGLCSPTLGPKQSDKVMNLCYSLEQSVKGERDQERERDNRQRDTAVRTEKLILGSGYVS